MNNELKEFLVQLGHASVRVQGTNEQEAIAAAKKRLSLDLPRLWDVIQSLEAHRFQVAVVGS